MQAERRSDFKDLFVWQSSMELAEAVHRLTAKLPRSELFGLSAQLRRAAVSVPSNIAEGSARRTTREFISFLHVARGSLSEIETQLMIAERVGYLHEVDLTNIRGQIATVGRLLNALLRGLRQRLAQESAGQTR